MSLTTNEPSPIPKIQLERLGRIYGKATHANSLIRMNVDLCIPKFWNEMLNDTLPHEAAHIISPLIYSPNRHGFDKNSGWGHGRAWAECMRVLGLQPKRCGSSFDEETLEKVSLRTVKRNYVYKCACSQHFMTALIHNRIQDGRQHRRCKKCRVRIAYIGMKA